MARLTAAQRRALPSSTFAGPDRSFPIPDKNHARAALREIHNAPASAQPRIRARAEAMLGKGKGKAKPKRRAKGKLYSFRDLT